MRYWWVNQNQTYASEVPGGFLWSPKRNRAGRKNRFYENMTLVEPGDIVFSFCDTKIKAIGRATGRAQSSVKPNFGAVGDQWDSEGWFVPVEFTELQSTIRPKDFIAELHPLLPSKYSPLQANGNGLQSVYLAELPEAAARKIFQKLNLPEGQIVNDVELADEYTKPEEEAEQLAIVGRTDIGETQKEQLVRARRGQGIFKANVRLTEKRCRVTGVSNVALLTASHIKPWAKSNDTEKLDGCNGLLLSPHVDRLFDRGLISFKGDGTLIVSQKLEPSVLQRWAIDQDKNVGAFATEQDAYLEYHRTNVFKL